MTVLEDFRPVSESLEWRIGAAYWETAGARAFFADHVPHLITNDGMLAVRDADVLFASCALAARAGALEHDIAVLELGAGLGVYARQFLDRFAAVCAHDRCDFYDRLTYYVTDRSGRMLDDIAAAGTLAPHDGRVRFGRADALDPAMFSPCDGEAPVALGALRAVVHSYVLDGLPFDVVLRDGEAWMRLHYRTSIDPAGASAIDPAWRAGNDDERLAELLPLSERLFVDQAFLSLDVAGLPFGQLLAPFAARRAAAADAVPSARAPTQPSFVHSHGALTSLTRAMALLRPDGYVLFHDYAARDAGEAPDKHQRFARSRATALNLALIDQGLAAEGISVSAPQDDADAPIHTRLLSARACPELERTFARCYGRASFERLSALVGEAHALREADPLAARAVYERAARTSPENWYLLVEWAELELGACDDPDAALALADRAVAMNPTGAPQIHGVRGDALAAVGATDEARAAYAAALALHPGDVRARTGMARLHAFEGHYPEAIMELAGAIACDGADSHRALLLARLDQVLDMRAGALQ
jgi:Flp pilus assembly protein TadD